MERVVNPPNTKTIPNSSSNSIGNIQRAAPPVDLCTDKLVAQPATRLSAQSSRWQRVAEDRLGVAELTCPEPLTIDVDADEWHAAVTFCTTSTRRARHRCLIKYPAKLLSLNLARRVPARDQNDADQEQNDFEGLQKPEQQAE